MPTNYDALLVVSFGGPEGREDVMPFLENVLRGKRVPKERVFKVAEHYYHFDGVSPINAQSRALVAALREEFDRHGLSLPIFWGNRNWHPLLPETVRTMKEQGVQRALAFVTSVFSSYSGCRQYLEDLDRAREEVGPGAPRIDKLRSPFNHPGFIEATADRVRAALAQVPESHRRVTQVIFTAHSIPTAMAERCAYVGQLQETCRLVAQAIGHANWALVYQSRSGPPNQPWLEPDVSDYLTDLRAEGVAESVILVPIGFISDHMEVLYDLDIEAHGTCQRLSLPMIRAQTVGTHDQFVAMIRELVQERREDSPVRPALGSLGPSPDVCPPECCPSGRPPSAR